MAVTEGTNCGFVLSTPYPDPGGGNAQIEYQARTSKFTSPATAAKITELGFYFGVSSMSAIDYDLAIYDHDSGNDRPGNVVGSIQTGSVNSIGWYRNTGLNINISGSTIYWLALQINQSAGVGRLDFDGGSHDSGYKLGVASLTDPFGTMTDANFDMYCIYALYEAGVAMQINILDSWRTVDGIQINIGDSWKIVDGAQINIGDSWKVSG